jgi:uncharacterized protein (TIGR03435 family)
MARRKRYSVNVIARTIAYGLLFGGALAAAGIPSFDIASVRPGSHSLSKVDRVDLTRFRAVSATLAELIEYAWRVRQDRISGPDGLKSNEYTFDIDATLPAAATDEQSRLMLRHLLADRFSLTLHTVITPRSGYALVVDKLGPHLKASSLPAAAQIRMSGDAADAKLRAPAVQMSQFAELLSLTLDTPVEDRTHLEGLFDIEIEFSRFGPNETEAPTVFDALKKLGLRFEKAKIPVETIVVDHANFKPSEN